MPGGEKVVPAINRIAEKFENGVLTQDWHPEVHRRQSLAISTDAHSTGGFANIRFGSTRHAVAGSKPMT